MRQERFASRVFGHRILAKLVERTLDRARYGKILIGTQLAVPTRIPVWLPNSTPAQIT
jgi:hypothetical protein